MVKAKIELDGHSYEIDVAVSEQLQEDALLAENSNRKIQSINR